MIIPLHFTLLTETHVTISVLGRQDYIAYKHGERRDHSYFGVRQREA